MPDREARLQMPAWVGAVYWRQALLCGPALMLVLAFSLELDPSVVAVIGGSAFSVAFGAARTLQGRRWAAMCMACFGVILATVLGSVVAVDPDLYLFLVAVLSAGCAALSAFRPDWWWVSLQVTSAFLVASYFPATGLDTALVRGGLVLIGGGAQIMLTLLLARLLPDQVLEPLPDAAPLAMPAAGLVRYALTAAMAVVGSLWLARQAGLHNDYWASIAALMVMRPGMHETSMRYLNRLLGTLAGCIVALVFIDQLHDETRWLAVGAVLSAALAFSFQKAHYALLTAMITMTVICLLAVGHGDPLQATEHRIEATLLGGATAMLAGLLLQLEGWLRMRRPAV